MACITACWISAKIIRERHRGVEREREETATREEKAAGARRGDALRKSFRRMSEAIFLLNSRAYTDDDSKLVFTSLEPVHQHLHDPKYVTRKPAGNNGATTKN